MTQTPGVQWYPGHMTKTKRMLLTQIGLVDVVVELLDARVPFSSQNPDIDSLAKSKKCVLVLNKSDLADTQATALWEEHFRSKGRFALSLNAKNAAGGVKRLGQMLMDVMQDKISRQKERGRLGASIKVMIVGIPNVGKSTFINQLSGKAGAKTADRPGVTRGRQWIRAEGFDLLDTPGILWPKFENQLVGLNLAATGAISDNVFDKELLGEHLLTTLYQINPDIVATRYFKGQVRAHSLHEIGTARGFKLKGDKIDRLRAAIILLDEFRGGKLGRISLERPGDFLN